MVNLLKKYWQSNRKAILSALIISVLLGGGFLVYLKFVGIPRTEARNLFNQAQLLLLDDKDREAKTLLDKAYETWPEEYILNLLQTF